MLLLFTLKKPGSSPQGESYLLQALGQQKLAGDSVSQLLSCILVRNRVPLCPIPVLYHCI